MIRDALTTLRLTPAELSSAGTRSAPAADGVGGGAGGDGVVAAVSLDVTDLARSCEYYAELLGFQVVATERPGLIYELRRLRSARFPKIELRLRAAFGRRPVGSTPGGMLALTLKVPNVAEALQSLGGKARWVGSPPGPDATVLRLADPDGYVIELEH